jgi:hypothetical protein
MTTHFFTNIFNGEELHLKFVQNQVEFCLIVFSFEE